ncbi:pyridoxamine 5'-phosphate oxidase family protein [Sphingobium phenoxybenzoativorans]|jgi:PPOX class probable F420-dependent enzyme|uniref:Pyridoxamine 5'-phosphate oxidase family protein n=1 Tax=Sphingobium phenoxybenzoativorans TaxID=1592790 RepID=A0A975KAR8_9SPHN|nr:pyridoxamine 5'-phosphate oxidase family protein [Sphingobium phenoxybenzoativorans]QUT07173.1 pyridoxamine 5'-phosphate oxidase family protein [Sphingobium phenoxybenzoativorans]
MAIKISENDEVRDFIDSQMFVHFSTLMKDGSPQVSPVGLDREGDLLLVNSAAGTLKVRNVERDPRVAISIHAPHPSSFWSYMLMRGRVVKVEGGEKGLEGLNRTMIKSSRLGMMPKLDDESKQALESEKGAADVKAAEDGPEVTHEEIMGVEERVNMFIEIDHIHHFLLDGRALVVSLTEDGERASPLPDPNRHKLWHKEKQA